MTCEAYLADLKTQAAVERKFEIIGELSSTILLRKNSSLGTVFYWGQVLKYGRKKLCRMDHNGSYKGSPLRGESGAFYESSVSDGRRRN
jgi:hypothetical protein